MAISNAPNVQINLQTREIQTLFVHLNEAHHAFNLYIASAECATDDAERCSYLKSADGEAQNALRVARNILKMRPEDKETAHVLNNVRTIRHTLKKMIRRPSRLGNRRMSHLL